MEEKKYMSNDIVAEMEKMLVLTARRQILRLINGKQFFAIIADESADISKTEQISISFRTASETYDVKEEFIGIMPCKEGLTADALLSYITDIFIRCGVNNDKFIGMSFDGASAMKSSSNQIISREIEKLLWATSFVYSLPGPLYRVSCKRYHIKFRIVTAGNVHFEKIVHIFRCLSKASKIVCTNARGEPFC